MTGLGFDVPFSIRDVHAMTKGSPRTRISVQSSPDDGGNLHCRVETIPEGRMLHLAVKERATYVQTAIRQWFH